MKFVSSDRLENPNPKRLRTLAADVKFPGGNTLLHQFVLDNSHPNHSGSENYINAVLLSMSDAPDSVVNAQNNCSASALYLAVGKNNLLMVKKLLSCLANIDVNARCRWGARGTVLQLAANLGHLSITRVLLDKGADISIINNFHETALSNAVAAGHLDVMKLLVSRGANVNQRCGSRTPLWHAAKKGNLEAVEFLVSSGADVNFRDGDAPLCSAARSGSLATVEFLVSNGADVNIKSRDFTYANDTPLHHAASLEIVEYLVRNGADINAKNKVGATPLHAAARNRKLENAAFLIDQGADLDSTDEWGVTPIHQAVLAKDVKTAALLLDHGADMKADIRGWTPLHAAAYKGHVEMIRVLVDKGADVNARSDFTMTTPLDLAREMKKQSCVHALENVR